MSFILLTRIIHKYRNHRRVSGKASGSWRFQARLSIFFGKLALIHCPQKKIYWSEKFFKNWVVHTALEIWRLSCTLYGVVLASKWFGKRTLAGWIGAQRFLILSRMYYKKSEPSLPYYLCLQQQLGQFGIKETNLASKKTPCPFAILLVLLRTT